MIGKVKSLLRKRKADLVSSIEGLPERDLRAEKLLCTDNIQRAKVVKIGVLPVIGILLPEVQTFFNLEQQPIESGQWAVIVWMIILFIAMNEFESSESGKKDLIIDEINTIRSKSSGEKN